MPTPIRIQLRLLGGFRAEVEGACGRTIRISSRKGRALLAYLAMRPGRSESRAQLADLLWGDRVDAQARHSLRQCLVVLRRDLETIGKAALAIEGETVALDPDLFSVDVADFMSLAESANTVDLARAVDLYHGEFLAELDLNAEAFDEWARQERDRLASLAMHAFARAAEAADAAGDGALAIATAERLVGFDPLIDEAQRLLLRLYARHRSRDAALAHAKTFAAALRRELDVEPDAETARLVDDIKQGMIPLARAAARHTLTIPVGAAGACEGVVDGGVAQETAARSNVGASRPAYARRVSLAAAALAAAIVIAVPVLPWVSHEMVIQQNESGTQATIGPTDTAMAVDQSWRSPGIYRNASVDGAVLASAHRQALVVLPLAVDDPADQAARALARRITIDLINDLSRAPTIRVISARTSQLYGGRPTDVAAVGAELGVHYVVEGNLRKEMSRISINVALTDAKTRLQAWSERFDRNLSERFAVQDEIVKGIARALQVAVIAEEGRQRRNESGDVGRLLAKGWAAIFRANETGGPGEASIHFEHVLRANPDNASALTGLAAHHVMMTAFEVRPDRKALLDRAEGLLTRALQKNPQSSPAYYNLGLVKKARGDLDAALESFAKAIEINPSHAPAYANAGHALVRLGRLDEGLDHVRYAIRLSPKDPALASWQVFGGEAEIARGNDEAAIAWLTRAITLSPRRPFPRALLAAAYALKGDPAAAAQQVAEWQKLVPGVASGSLMTTLGGGGVLGGRLTTGLRLALGHSS